MKIFFCRQLSEFPHVVYIDINCLLFQKCQRPKKLRNPPLHCVFDSDVLTTLFLLMFFKVRGTAPSLHRAGLCLQWVGICSDTGGTTSSTARPSHRDTDHSQGLPDSVFCPMDWPTAAKWEDYILWTLQKTDNTSPHKFRPRTCLQWLFNILQRWPVVALHRIRISGGI